MCSGLKKVIKDGGFMNVTTLEPVTSADLHDTLKTSGPFDVLHYMGTGALQDGQAEVVFMDANEHEDWTDVHGILTTAAETGVRLVVLELMNSPQHREFQQLTYHELDRVIRGTVPAVVFTNLPVYPDQCDKFNREFYKALGRGKSVEKAVQKARWTLQNGPPAGDAAGFGWFTLATCRRADTCFVTPPPPSLPDPAQSGAHAPEPQTSGGWQ